jgi:hypothetical protein
VIAHEYFFRWHRRDPEDPETVGGAEMGNAAAG